MEVEKYNLGTEANIKFVNIGKCCTPTKKEEFVHLLHQYIDILAYSYDDFKYFFPNKIQNNIPLKADVVPFRQNRRQYNPNISGTIVSKIQKILNSWIIFSIHHSTQIANIVLVCNKYGEICICMDFKNLN